MQELWATASFHILEERSGCFFLHGDSSKSGRKARSTRPGGPRGDGRQQLGFILSTARTPGGSVSRRATSQPASGHHPAIGHRSSTPGLPGDQLRKPTWPVPPQRPSFRRDQRWTRLVSSKIPTVRSSHVAQG